MTKTEQPIIFNENSFTQKDLDEFLAQNKVWRTIDIYRQQREELYEIENPHAQNDAEAKNQFINSEVVSELQGCWIYYPWSGVFLHCVGESDLFKLRTNRNKNLITEDEQDVLNQTVVGICGLSVGNSIALTMAYSGIARNMKLTDFDKVETPNLNRLRAGLQHIGEPKIAIASQQIWELNPFAHLDLYEEGLQDLQLDDFFLTPKLNVVFDEIDDFPMKIKLRLKARETRVPVIMLTSLGDSVLIDIERYDLDSSTPLFNGLVGDTPEEILTGFIGELEKVKYAIELVGLDNIPTRALESLFEINRSLVGRPQLASTITLDGGLGSYLVRRIALKQDLPSGRYNLSLEKAIGLSEEFDASRRHAVVDKLNLLLSK